MDIGIVVRSARASNTAVVISGDQKNGGEAAVNGVFSPRISGYDLKGSLRSEESEQLMH